MNSKTKLQLLAIVVFDTIRKLNAGKYSKEEYEELFEKETERRLGERIPLSSVTE